MHSLLISLLLLSPFSVLLAETESTQLTNTGFVSNVIWYSKDPFYAGETVRVYTLLFNPTEETLRGRVVFRDGEFPIGEYALSIPKSQAKDISISWKATEGKHTIAATIEDAELVAPDGTIRKVTLASAKTPVSEREAVVPGKTAFAPAQLLESVANSSAVTNATAFFSDAIEKGITALPDTVATPLQEGTSFLEEKRKETGKVLGAKRDASTATLTKESLFTSPFDTVALFGASIGASLVSHPLFTYATLLFFALFAVSRIRRFMRGY